MAVVTTMEQNIKSLLKDFEGKKKVTFLLMTSYQLIITVSPSSTGFTGQFSNGDWEKTLCLFLH